MIIAIYKKDGKLFKTTNLLKKEKKLGDLDTLWKMEFEGSMKEAERLLDEWIRNNGDTDSNLEEREVRLYYYKALDKKSWIISIYDKYVEGYERIEEGQYREEMLKLGNRLMKK